MKISKSSAHFASLLAGCVGSCLLRRLWRVLVALTALTGLTQSVMGHTTEPHQHAKGETVYLVTVPLVGHLIRDLLGPELQVVVISESLDYHGPQVTPRQLQAWTNVSHIFWFGAAFEPQMVGLVDKIAAQSAVETIVLPVAASADEPLEATQASTEHAHEHKHVGDVGAQVTEKPTQVTTIHKDMHRGAHSSIHKTSAEIGRVEHGHPSNKHTHHHHSDPTYAHPWLAVEIVRRWADRIVHFGHKQHLGSQTQRQARYDAWAQALDEMTAEWRSKFNQVPNRSFVQEHAALEPLAQTFALEPIGALTTQHDAAIGVKQLLALKRAVREHKTRCFVALPNSQINLPPSLFAEPPRKHEIDPLVGSAAPAPEGKAVSVLFYETLLAELHACLVGQ